MPLRRPPRALHEIALPTVSLAAGKLWRVSSYASGEPHFGKAGVNRFDDRSRPKRDRFGTCYFGISLNVAIAETVLHDEMPNSQGEFEIAAQEFERRYLVRLRGDNLILANLTGTALKRLGGDGSMSTVVPPDLPQLWSMAIHRHPQTVDGILYMSRHVNDQQAVVLYDHAASKLQATRYTPLPKVAGAARSILDLHIQFGFD